MTASTPSRFEFRVKADSKQRIEHAANLVNESTSDFVRAAAERRAEEVLLDHDVVTRVPADFFNQLIEALDEPPKANAALKRGARRAQRVVRR